MPCFLQIMLFSYKLITATICSFLSVSNHSDFDIVFLIIYGGYIWNNTRKKDI